MSPHAVPEARTTTWARALTCALAVGTAACTGSSGESMASLPALTQTQLLDPQSCAPCHASHVGAWSASMHAYASDDPLFVAMNARFQRDTDGTDPGFCVQCHAPMALRTGATVDGTDLDAVPSALHGVTCFFCHSVDAAPGSNDDPLDIAADGAMRGEIRDPSPPPPHGAVYSPLHDASDPRAAALCGSCHDVTTSAGVAVETTYAEWQNGLYAQGPAADRMTCAGCHMTASSGPASSLPGAPARSVHDHSFVAVDVASRAPDDERPEEEDGAAGEAAAEDGTAESDADAAAGSANAALPNALVQSKLDAIVVARLCVAADTAVPAALAVTVTLENAFAGHAWPSGAVHDRRAWVEIVASSGGQIIYQSGVVAPGQDVTTLADPDLWLFRETLLDARSDEVKMMWQAATAIPSLLPVAVTTDPSDPGYDHSVTKTYTVPTSVDSVSMRLRMIPVGLDVVAALVASGDLDPAYAAGVPVYTLGGTSLTWSIAGGFGCVE